MQAKYITSAVAVIALSGSCALAPLAANAGDNNSDHRWMPKQPVDSYWQAPDFNFPSANRSAAPFYTPPRAVPPVNDYAYRPAPVPPPARYSTRPPAPVYRPSYPAKPNTKIALTAMFQPEFDFFTDPLTVI